MKYIQITLFVIVYITLGFLLKLTPNEYLLLGIPLGLGFQLLVRKKSIHQAWVRTEEPFYLHKNALIYAALLSIYPCIQLFKVITKSPFNITSLFYNLSVLVGAVGCGYAISKLTKKTGMQTLYCLLTAGLVGTFMMVGIALLKSALHNNPFHFNAQHFLVSMLTYTPIVFVLEEVLFRGILDEHISSGDQKINYGSIVYLSVLWGWWHLPVTKGNLHDLFTASLILPINHTVVGFFISLYWRKSGNLLVPGFAHAFIDAIRNAMLK